MADERHRLTLSSDGMRRMFIVKSCASKLFRFQEETYVYEENGDFEYWSPSLPSGLYESIDEAERAAYLELSWLRENSN